jgi:hypothetical protein
LAGLATPLPDPLLVGSSAGLIAAQPVTCNHLGLEMEHLNSVWTGDYPAPLEMSGTSRSLSHPEQLHLLLLRTPSPESPLFKSISTARSILLNGHFDLFGHHHHEQITASKRRLKTTRIHEFMILCSPLPNRSR